MTEGLKQLRLLLVEDSERDAALLTLYLKRGGYNATIVRVESADDFKKHLYENRWDVIVSDFNLPGCDGFASLKVLKESGRKIPFVVLSGEVNQKVIDGMIAAGASEYLCKYEMRQIVPVIDKVLGYPERRA